MNQYLYGYNPLEAYNEELAVQDGEEVEDKAVNNER